MSDNKSTNKTIRQSLLLDEALAKALKEAAYRDRLSVNEYIRAALWTYIEGNTDLHRVLHKVEIPTSQGKLIVTVEDAKDTAANE